MLPLFSVVKAVFSNLQKFWNELTFLSNQETSMKTVSFGTSLCFRADFHFLSHQEHLSPCSLQPAVWCDVCCWRCKPSLLSPKRASPSSLPQQTKLSRGGSSYVYCLYKLEVGTCALAQNLFLFADLFWEGITLNCILLSGSAFSHHLLYYLNQNFVENLRYMVTTVTSFI